MCPKYKVWTEIYLSSLVDLICLFHLILCFVWFTDRKKYGSTFQLWEEDYLEFIKQMQQKHAIKEDHANKNLGFKTSKQELQVTVLVGVEKELVQLLKIIVVLCICILVCNVYHVIHN